MNAVTPLAGEVFFEYWSRLAKENPERFEIERRKAIAETISQAPIERRERLWLFQSLIDALRAEADDPFTACVRLNRALLGLLCDEEGLMSTYHNLLIEHLKFLKQYKGVVNLLSSGKPPMAQLN